MASDDLPGRWTTASTECTVLVLAHTVASVMRMLDLVALFERDKRVRAIWTIAPDRLGKGVSRLLERLGVHEVPWQEAVKTSYDLAICTSLHQMDQVTAKKKFAAPHGCGYGKRYPSWAWPIGEATPVYGLDPQSLLDQAGRPVFDGIVLSHTDQVQILLQQCPEAAHTAIIGGDPAFDRLLASRPFRESYRLDLNVRRGQILVAVASTWGGESLMARYPDLPARLQHELPASHRVIMTLHPAAWYEHGPRQIRAYLRDATEAGLDLIGPGADWRPLLAAADFMISDHTSLTSYAAAAGLPVLLSHYAEDEIAPGSLITDLATQSPRYNPDIPLVDQLRAACRARPFQQQVGLRRVSSVLGGSAAILRKALYGLMRLPEPHTPPRVEAVPLCGLDQPENP